MCRWWPSIMYKVVFVRLTVWLTRAARFKMAVWYDQFATFTEQASCGVQRAGRQRDASIRQSEEEELEDEGWTLLANLERWSHLGKKYAQKWLRNIRARKESQLLTIISNKEAEVKEAVEEVSLMHEETKMMFDQGQLRLLVLRKEQSDHECTQAALAIEVSQWLHWLIAFFRSNVWRSLFQAALRLQSICYCQLRGTSKRDMHVQHLNLGCWYLQDLMCLESVKRSCSVSWADDLQSHLLLRYVLLLFGKRRCQHWVFACAKLHTKAKFITLPRQSMNWTETLITYKTLQMK